MPWRRTPSADKVSLLANYEPKIIFQIQASSSATESVGTLTRSAMVVMSLVTHNTALQQHGIGL